LVCLYFDTTKGFKTDVCQFSHTLPLSPTFYHNENKMGVK
jgi:hypothetical protein